MLLNYQTKTPYGYPLVKGRFVTGFANSEEAAIGLTQVVPFLVEDMLKENGGIYSKAADWHPHVVVDGNLITGQNPAADHQRPPGHGHRSQRPGSGPNRALARGQHAHACGHQPLERAELNPFTAVRAPGGA